MCDDRELPAGPPGKSATIVALIGVVGLLAMLATAACRTIQDPVPINAWDDVRFGPLVPHDTFPGDCGLCHVPERWDVLRDDFAFDHEAETGVALEGAHTQAACLRCHNDRGPVQQYVARGCSGCHVDPHAGRLGTDCAHCHHQVDWRPTGMIAEHATTRFPLTGAHAGIACDACHRRAKLGDFRGEPTECHLCHMDDLARATDPDHRQSGLVRDCQRCHSTVSWAGAAFDHTTFPLTGAHARADCLDCHVGGRYRGTPRDCIGCHQQDYQQATNPNHVTAQFPTTCEVCHSTVAWRPASFNHDPYFPISSGDHSGLSCIDCHPGNNYNTFSCITCHAHRRTEMDDEHRGVPGYMWVSAACLQCHPRGRER